jgi:hypothetical protein
MIRNILMLRRTSSINIQTGGNMSKPIAYVLFGHDNDSYMLQDAGDLVRCSVCGELLERPRLIPTFKIHKKRDVSATYDGYMIVSQRFVDEWTRSGGTGLNFAPLPAEPGYFALDADQVIEFDSDRRKTRFEQHRPCCNRFHSVAGATPAFLKSPQSLSATQAARTDVMFGSGDGKSSLIIIPLKLGNALKRSKLSGLDLSDVLA